ncbi:MAG: LysM peptidoglycan-binding domain-containing protein [Anaerolineales bacterium]|nr:LysM peptidoglycan-binding domain-containing protein [Anaerolineales bacterium]
MRMVLPAIGLGTSACMRTVSPARFRSMRLRPVKTFLLALLSLSGLGFGADGPPMGYAGRRPSEEYYAYRSQSGDSLSSIAVRFGVGKSEIWDTSGLHLSDRGFLAPGLILSIPKRLAGLTESTHLLPDAEFIHSQTSAKFDVENFILGKRGFLLHYRDEDGRSGADIIAKLARDNSVNPGIMLSLLEYTSGWLTQTDPAPGSLDYPMRFRDIHHRGLYSQMMLAVDYLERGYYGWREAKILRLYFNDGQNIRLAPDLNAGTVAVMYYFSRITGTSAAWRAEMEKFLGIHSDLFGDPRAAEAAPLYSGEVYQPYLILPFGLRQSWCFSNGPHGAWDAKGPAAALDFAPPQDEFSGPLTRMILASASGCVVRSEKNTVVLDLDCDGSEQTGWNLVYYHLAEQGRARQNSRVFQGQKIGYASCEGGLCTGIHVHMARKFNGEWMLAGGPIPFVLSGWNLAAYETEEAGAGWKYFRDGRTVIASIDCDFENMIFR